MTWKEEVIQLLKKNIERQEANNFKGMNEDFDAIEVKIYEAHGDSSAVCQNFLDCWCDEVNHDFANYHGLSKEQWPTYAKKIIDELENDGEIQDQDLKDKFILKPPKKSGFLKKLLKIAGFFLLFLILLYLVAGYYFFKYPKNVTMDAHNSVIVEENILDLFEKDSKFLDSLLKSKSRMTSFEKAGDRSQCLTIHLDNRRKVAKLFSRSDSKYSEVWNGPINAIREGLEAQKDLVTECEKYCVTFMPAFMFRGSFCINYDRDLKIKSKDKPRFWD